MFVNRRDTHNKNVIDRFDDTKQEFTRFANQAKGIVNNINGRINNDNNNNNKNNGNKDYSSVTANNDTKNKIRNFSGQVSNKNVDKNEALRMIDLINSQPNNNDVQKWIAKVAKYNQDNPNDKLGV